MPCIEESVCDNVTRHDSPDLQAQHSSFQSQGMPAMLVLPDAVPAINCRGVDHNENIPYLLMMSNSNNDRH